MRKPKRYHYIYKTTCKVTGNFYVGMHSTDELEDGYLGSGIKLWHSIRKHGKENHEREILEFLTDRDSLRLREKEIVNEQFLENPKCMNLTTGGHGGFDLSYNECVKNGAKGLAAQKWLKENPMTYLFASDEKLELANYFGVHISPNDFANAATFVIDSNKAIKLSYNGKRTNVNFEKVDEIL